MAEEVIPTEFTNDGSLGPTVQNLNLSPKLQNRFGGFSSYDDQLQNYIDNTDIEELALSGASNTAVARYLANNAPSEDGKKYSYEAFKKNKQSDDQIIARFSNATVKTIPSLFAEKVSKGIVEEAIPLTAAYTSAIPAFVGATAAAAPFTGPFAPIIGTGAAALTAYSAYKATQGIGSIIHKKMFPYETLPTQRALGQTFFTWGSGISAALAPKALSTFMLPGTAAGLRNILTLERGGKLTPIDQIGMSYLRYPGRTTAIEGTSLLGSGYGTFIAETSKPGDVLLRMGAETLTGVFSPVGATGVEKIGSKFFDRGKSFLGIPNVVKTRLNPEGYAVTNNALIDQGKRIKKAMEKAGEEGDFQKLLDFTKSPEGQKLLDDLYSTLPPNERLKFGPRTTASYLDNKYLLGLQKLLRRESENFDVKVKNEYIKTFTESQDVVTTMYASGDAKLIAKAAELEVATMQHLIARSLQTASENAGQTISKIVGTDTESAMNAGRIIEKLMENTNTDLRALETSLYNNIDGKALVGTDSFLKEYDDTLTKLLDKEEGPLIPLAVRTLIFKAKGGTDDIADVTAKDVFKLQTKIKTLVRNNAELNQTFPETNTYFSNLETEIAGLTPEMKLVKLQEELGRLSDIDVNQKDLNLYNTTLKRHNNSLNEKRSPFVDRGLDDEIGSIHFYGSDGQGVLYEGNLLRNSNDIKYKNLSKKDKIDILKTEQQRRVDDAEIYNKKTLDQLQGKKEAKSFYDDAIYLLENDTPVIKSVKDKGKLVRYLENKIKINYNTSLLDDLNNTAPISPELVDNSISIDEMRRARTLLMNQARISIAASDYDRSRILSNLADSIKDDIGYSVTPQDGVPLTPNQIAIKNAVNFSSAYNDVFSRAYPSSILANQKSGARKIMPELLLQSSFSGPGDATALRFKGMRDAIELLSEEGGKRFEDTATARFGTLDAAQSDFIKAAFDEITIPAAVAGEPVTVDPQALANFNKKYRNLLESFPAVKSDLANVESANNLMRTEQKNMQTILAQTKLNAVDENNVPILSFANFLGAETNPGLIIDQQVGSPGARNTINPQKALAVFTQKVVKASNSGKFEGIKEGFVDTVLDRGVKFSQKNTKGLMDFKAFKEYLFSPITKGNSTVMEIMRTNGAISLPETIRLKNMVDDMVKYTDDLEIDPVSKLPVSLTKRGTNLLTTVFSTGLVGLLKKSVGLEGVGAGGIAVPAAAAELGKEIVTKIPSAMKVKLLEDAMRDPELFKVMMDKTMDATKQVDNIKFLYGYMVNSGLIAASSENRKAREKQFRETKFLEQKRLLLERTKNKRPSGGLSSELLNIDDQQSSVQTQPLPTPTEVSANLPRPGLNVNAGGPPVSNQQVAGSNSSVTPERLDQYKALFGQDSISQTFAAKGGLVRGIGSLV